MIAEFEAWIMTHRGRVREMNEDCLLIGKQVFSEENFDSPKYLGGVFPGYLCVADGMGGHEAGEYASRLCCQVLSDCVDECEEALKNRLVELNRTIHEQSLLEPTRRGMGSTVAGLTFLGEDLYAFNVGDSRVYRIQDRFLNKITKDDTSAQALEDAGVLEPGEVRPETSHSLTQALGGAATLREISPNTYRCNLRTRAAYLLCTDGLTDMLGLDQMEEKLNMDQPDSVVSGLFQAAMEAGGKDNVSIIYLQVERASKGK